MTMSYVQGLEPRPLLSEIRRLLDLERRAEWLICRYLADLADGERYRAFGCYSDIYHFAWVQLRLGVRRTRERVRVGKALRELPALEVAFAEGEIGFGRVREVTRVATPETEAKWLEAARRLPMRVLERRVVEAGGGGGGGGGTDEPAKVEWRTPETVEVRLRMTGVAWALLEKAMETARSAAEASLSDAEAIEAVAREAMARLGEGADAADPRRTVVLYECRECERTELDTGRGPVELSPEQAARLACGATEVDLASEGRTVSRGGPIPSAIRRAVLLRDRGRCRVPGCNRRRHVDVHHVRPRARGGEHSRANCVCLCTTCHQALHEGALRFFDADGAQILEGDVTQVGSRARLPSSGDLEGRILSHMGRRGGWLPDTLMEEIGLSPAQFMPALAMLEIDGRVRRDRDFRYHPAEA